MYNCEKYIEQCLGSIFAQTFKDFEVIVADDCSTDRSVAIVEKIIAARSTQGANNVRLLKLTENSGAAAIPRNHAMKFACGKYITFVDADDLIVNNALEILFNNAEKFDADVVHAERFFQPIGTGDQFNAQTKMGIGTWQEGGFVNKPTLETSDIGVRIIKFCQKHFLWSAWNKLFRREFLIEHQIEFVNARAAEDLILTSFCICLAKNYLRIPDIFYVYRQNPNSVTRSHTSFDKEVSKIVPPIAESIRSWNKYFNRIAIFKDHPEFRFMLINFFFQMQVINEGSLIYSKFPLHAFEKFIMQEFSKYDGKDAVVIMTYLFNIAAVNHRQFLQSQFKSAQLDINLRQSQEKLAKLEAKLQKLKSLSEELQTELQT